MKQNSTRTTNKKGGTHMTAKAAPNRRGALNRRLDELGRIVIPINYRRELGISEDDRVNIFMEGNRIWIEKRVDTCSVCRSTEGVQAYNETFLCVECYNKLDLDIA